MEKKTPAESLTILSQVMMPYHASHYGNVHGGIIMKLVDEVAYVAASRHARCNVVTASIDSLDFKHPVRIGDVVTLRAKLVFVGKTSMEVEVHVETERIKTGETLPVATAYLTMVALNEEGHPTPVPQLILETEEERKKYQEAKLRRERKLEKIKKVYP
ncbi:acyl-CoA thioesterase [Candidatus Aerophobetes bacterium]|nr:acyl-CoA thioesterase [Candidatus Aerophobetes bacterium]